MTPSVNSAPAPPSAVSSQAGQPAPGIVSVNRRGGASTNQARRAILFFVIVSLIGVGIIYGINTYRAHQRDKEARALEDGKNSNKSALVGKRRNFSSDPPAVTAGPPPQESAKPSTPKPPPNVAVPAITPVPNVPLHQGSKDPRNKPPSRYAGDVIVPENKALATVATSVGSTSQRDRSAQYQQIMAASGSAPGQRSPPNLRVPQPIGANPQGSAAMFTTGGTPPLNRAVNADRGSPINVGPKDSASVPSTGGASVANALAQADRSWPMNEGSNGSMDSDAPISRGPDARGRETGMEQSKTTGKLDSGLLKGSKLSSVRATMLGNRSLTLPKGATIDCSLATYIVSDNSGMAECTVSSDVYSEDGRVLLIEAGSQASGEYVAGLTQGQKRLFIVWTRVKTPTGVVIELESPGSDALGASGLPGYVDNHWGERIGAALLLSVIQDGIAYAVSSDRNSVNNDSGNVFVNTREFSYENSRRTGERLAEIVLRSTINIKPTFYKNQGDRAAIYVARDLDFESVYALRRK